MVLAFEKTRSLDNEIFYEFVELEDTINHYP